MKKIIYFINTLTTSHASLIKYLLSEINLELHKKLIHNGFEEVKKNLLNEIEIAELNKLINFNKILEKIKVK